jgi:hypothetical protein
MGHHDKRDARYGHQSGSGSNQPKQAEKKERDPEWIHRQGGDQTRPGDNPARDAAPDEAAQGKQTKPPPDVLTRRHVEGAEQGPA